MRFPSCCLNPHYILILPKMGQKMLDVIRIQEEVWPAHYESTCQVYLLVFSVTSLLHGGCLNSSFNSSSICHALSLPTLFTLCVCVCDDDDDDDDEDEGGATAAGPHCWWPIQRSLPISPHYFLASGLHVWHYWIGSMYPRSDTCRF
jgi:hypothetical protein